MSILKYMGPNGELGQKQSDGSIEMGDSLCWTSHAIYLGAITHPDVSFFEVAFGAYVRHPYPELTNKGFGAFYLHPWDGCISRDQMTPLIAVLIQKRKYKASFRFLIHHSFRLFLFAYNNVHNGAKVPTNAAFRYSYPWKVGDITFMNIWAMELRMFGPFSWLFWPLLNILDLHLLIDTILFNKMDDDTDQINFAVKHFVNMDHVPTIISMIAWKILDKEKLKDLIGQYWGGWRSMPEMTKYFERKINQLEGEK